MIFKVQAMANHIKITTVGKETEKNKRVRLQKNKRNSIMTETQPEYPNSSIQ